MDRVHAYLLGGFGGHERMECRPTALQMARSGCRFDWT